MVATEAGLAAVVLGVTAALVASQPARTAQIESAAQQRSAQDRAQQDRAQPTREPTPEPTRERSVPVPTTTRIGFDTGGPGGQGVLDIAVFPATVGSNEMHLAVLDTSGSLLEVPEVTATLNLPDRALGPLAVPLQRFGPGHYVGAATVPVIGQWQLAVTVRTSEVDQDTVSTFRVRG